MFYQFISEGYMSVKEKVVGFFKKKEKTEGEKTVVQAILFTLLSMVAFVSQLILVNVIPLIYKDTTPISAWIFGEQARNAFVAFLISNTAAKVISYVLNRKKTFAAVNNLTFSIVTYVIMCVTLIIVETLIGEPLAEAYFKLFGGKVKIEVCRTISMITYSMLDFVIVFLMEKFVIMNDKLFKKKTDAAEQAEVEEATEDPSEEKAE